MPIRLFTREEANRALASLTNVLERAQQTLSQMRHVRDQLVDLRIIWEEKILDVHCPDYGEYERYQAEFGRLEKTLEQVTKEATDSGCELKDVEHGLIDFFTHRGEELVYFCWKKGEPEISFWHPVEGGFAARQPMETF